MRLFTSFAVLFFATISSASANINEKLERALMLKDEVLNFIKTDNQHTAMAKQFEINYILNLEKFVSPCNTDKGNDNYLRPGAHTYISLQNICMKNSIVNNAPICKLTEEILSCETSLAKAEERYAEIAGPLGLLNASLKSIRQQDVYFFKIGTVDRLFETYDSLNQLSQNNYYNKTLIEQFRKYGNEQDLAQLKRLLTQLKSATQDILQQLDLGIKYESTEQKLAIHSYVQWAHFFKLTTYGIHLLETDEISTIETDTFRTWLKSFFSGKREPIEHLTINNASVYNYEKLIREIQVEPTVYTLID